MPPRFRHLLLALALAPLSFGAAAAKPPQAASQASVQAEPASASYAADLSAFLASVRWFEKATKSPPSAPTAFEREFTQAFFASLTPAQFYMRAMPVFARHITPKQAAALGAMARKRPVPLGQQQAALQAFWTMEKQIGPELGPVWRDLSIDFGQRMQARMVTEVRRAITEVAQHRGTGHTVKLNKIGLSYLDRMAWLSVNHVIHQMNASDVMDQSCMKANMEDALHPAKLLAENGIALARQSLDGCEGALETLEKSTEQSFTQMRADILKLDLPSGVDMAAKLDERAREFYDYILKHGELTRQFLAAQRQLVSLVEARRATVQLDGDRLMFASDEDVAEANRSIDDARMHAKNLNDFVYRARQNGVLRNIDLRDGITAPDAPVQAPAAGS